MSDDNPTLEETAALLAEVFPGAHRIDDPAYLRWLYEASPFGGVVQVNRTDDAGLSAHYAVVPVDLSIDGARVPGALSLNTAVSERARGGGVFVTLAAETYELAQTRGIRVVTGVANANSTPGFLRRLEFTNQGPLPASVLLPTPGSTRGVRRAVAGLASPLLDDVGALLAPSASGLTRRWTADTLAWRLASPGAAYTVHRSANALVISTGERRAGLGVGIILAAFAAGPVGAGETRRLVRSVCLAHRAPAALHAGFNDRVSFRGPPLPERLRPSPLNLITRDLTGAPVPAPTRWELLDFDAY